MSNDIILCENVFDCSNFPDWEMDLKIVLRAAKLLYVIEKPLGPEPEVEQIVEHELWKTHYDDNSKCSIRYACRNDSLIPSSELRIRSLYNDVKIKDIHRSNLRS